MSEKPDPEVPKAATPPPTPAAPNPQSQMLKVTSGLNHPKPPEPPTPSSQTVRLRESGDE